MIMMSKKESSRKGNIMKITLDNSERIMAAYKPLILKTVKKFSAFEEDEAIDEARMILINAIGSYEQGRGTFGNYLQNKLRYYFLDKAKEKRPTSIYEKNDKGVEIIEEIPGKADLEEDLVQKEEEKKIRKSLEKIDKKNSLILKLKYYQDLTNKEIGQKMNLSPKTVANRLSLGIKELRKVYQTM